MSFNCSHVLGVMTLIAQFGQGKFQEFVLFVFVKIVTDQTPAQGDGAVDPPFEVRIVLMTLIAYPVDIFRFNLFRNGLVGLLRRMTIRTIFLNVMCQAGIQSGLWGDTAGGILVNSVRPIGLFDSDNNQKRYDTETRDDNKL